MTAMPVTIQERIPLPPGLPARPGAATAAGLAPSDILRILKQRLFMILTIWILATGAAVGLTWYLDRYHQEYTAKGYVRVDSPFPRTPNTLMDPAMTGEIMNRYVSDQAMLMKDDQVLRDALLDPAVVATGWYRDQADKHLILEHLREELGASPNVGTSYITITFAASTPEDAATLVNTVMNRYDNRVQEMSRTQYQLELKDYRDQEQKLTRDLDKLLDEKQQFMAQQLASPGIAEGVNVTGETLRSYAMQVTLLEQEKLQAKAMYDNLQGLDPTQIVISPEMQMLIQQDPRVNSLQQGKSALELERGIALQSYGPNHRSVKAIEDRIQILDQQLQEVLQKKEKEVRDYQVNSAYTRYLNALQAEMQLRERMAEQEAKQRDLDQAYVRFRNIEDRQVLLTGELNDIRTLCNQLQLMIKDQGMVRVKLFPAMKPELKSFPQWKMMVPGGSILGLLVAVGLALLLELMDTSLRTPRDLVRHVHVPILGTVPDLDDEEIPIDRIELAAHTAPRSMTAESFRAIRTNLLLSSPAERQRTVLITSARPEEGKTAIACNLAISIAQSGRRVLLVDANFHRPILHQIFNRPQNEGLSNALIGQAQLQDLVKTTDLPNIDVITSGPIPPNPTELLAGPYLRELIAQAAGRYDQVLFDGPPILLLSDALVLASTLDGVICVCRAKATSRGAMQRAREQIERVNGRIFGAILNAVRVRRGGYYREQIRSYYEYQPEEALTGGAKALPRDGNGKTDAS